MRKHVLPTFGAVPLARVDRSSLREWVAQMANPDEGGTAPAPVVKNVQVFNKLMRAAVDDRLISANPLERLPLPRIEREEMRFLTPAELAKACRHDRSPVSKLRASRGIQRASAR